MRTHDIASTGMVPEASRLPLRSEVPEESSSSPLHDVPDEGTGDARPEGANWRGLGGAEPDRLGGVWWSLHTLCERA